MPNTSALDPLAIAAMSGAVSLFVGNCLNPLYLVHIMWGSMVI
jgi:hypothetical protein